MCMQPLFFAQIFMDDLVKIVECVKNDLTICENGYILNTSKNRTVFQKYKQGGYEWPGERCLMRNL